MKDDMPDWLQRLIRERNDLSAKIRKLIRFRRTDAFQELDIADKKDLRDQHTAIINLVTILNNRIRRATGKH